MTRPDVELQNVAKSYGGGAPAVDDLSLAVANGELISLLGPSGCGKTTTLRIVGGFVTPDAGRVLLKGVDVTERPPNKRDVGMLFQSYALFPHMTVGANVAYGLRMRRTPQEDLRRRVEEALDLVRLSEFTDRYPRQLSGGQQQRVALARAIVIRPAVLLLDEPLSNLDAKLRHDMRREIRQLQQHLKITTIFVTHDQEEALTMSDRIVVMNRGRVEQQGSPSDVYRFPRSLFVAQFIGEANVLSGRLESTGPGKVQFETVGGLRILATATSSILAGTAAIVAIRPEAMQVFSPGDHRLGIYENQQTGEIEGTTYLGHSTIVHIRLSPDVVLHVTRQTDEADPKGVAVPLKSGEPAVVAWRAESAKIIEAA